MTSSNNNESRILVLEPDEQLASSIQSALREAVPDALVEMARDLREAQQLVIGVKPDLFVLDVDATHDLGQDFLYDLRTSHPNARAIILTMIHLPSHREQVAGLGAIHFLEKPFPHAEFVDLVRALLRPTGKAESEKFQGTLRDLHIADIIQLKCMSRATSAVEFTGPRGEKARVFFEDGQVRHATAPGREGLAAFNEIVSWKGGTISEVSDAAPTTRTIDLDWQVLLMEATRKLDESAAARRARPGAERATNPKVLVIDDSLMLLSFVQEVLIEANFDVTTVATGEEGLRATEKDPPDLILLDYILPGMKGDEVCRKLLENPATAAVPVVYMSGFSAELRPEQTANPNVVGFLNKPFTSDLLLQTVETHMPKSPEESEQPQVSSSKQESAPVEFPVEQEEAAYGETTQVGPAPAEATEAPWWSAAAAPTEATLAPPDTSSPSGAFTPEAIPTEWSKPQDLPDESVTGGAFFCGDTRFFSLHWALQTIAHQKLSGTLRLFWSKEPLDLFTQDGRIVLATTRDPELYCPEAPVTLLSVDAERIAFARDQQRRSGCPLFLTLAQEDLILQEPAVQLVQHHGQKLFAQLWTAPYVRFAFYQGALPSYANSLPAEGDVDQWSLSTLRLIQFQELGDRANYDTASIPAYTKDGYDRVQNLRLTVAEAQFASQFNGSRSIQQIAKNLRLDLKFARLTLFRFLALEIVECWPPSTAVKPESKGVFQRLARSIGLGE
jgi:DNA-binding response OmpR family regulator